MVVIRAIMNCCYAQTLLFLVRSLQSFQKFKECTQVGLVASLIGYGIL